MPSTSPIRTSEWRSRRVEGPTLRSVGRHGPLPKPTGERAELLADAIAGLGKTPKTLPSKWMFDAAGARLFDCLASLDDHSFARSELAILDAHAADVAAAIGPKVRLVDLACGDGSRTLRLAAELTDPDGIVVSDRPPHAPVRAATALLAARPGVPVVGLPHAEAWTPRALERRGAAGRTVVYVGAATFGEREPRDARTWLTQVGEAAGPDAGLLVGLDLRKDRGELESAYSDRAGVAASFTRNLLARINREIDGGFQLAAFDHRAVYDPTKRCVELQLVSKRWQWAAVHEHWFHFRPAEPIVTMVVYTYAIESFGELASAAGWKLERVFLDPDRKYALVLARSGT
jgi:dimethylhistidine N-methyltransferase